MSKKGGLLLFGQKVKIIPIWIITFGALISISAFASSVVGVSDNDIRAGKMNHSGCSVVTPAMTLTNTPSRNSGVAPLSVFFDTSGTIATDSLKVFHDLEYRWDFGEQPVLSTTLPKSENWTNGSNGGRRNLALGPVAAHVYETPGVYTVTLTATNGKNSVLNKCVRIVVQEPDVVFEKNNTICIGAKSIPVAGENGCPTGARTVKQESFPMAVNAYALEGERVLFQRGDTFTAATTARLNRNGPGILGAFGLSDGGQPKVQMTGNVAILMLSSRGSPNIRDWRIMDLEFDGQSQAGSIGIDTDGGINQVLIHKMNMHDIGNGIMFNDSILTAWYLGSNLTAHKMFDEISITDSIVTPIMNSGTGWRILMSATRGSIQGNKLGNFVNNKSMGSHVVRVPYMDKGVIANNDIARAGASQLAIKMHSQGWCESTSAPGTCKVYDNVTPPPTYTYRTNTHPIGIFSALSGYTEKVVISDNKIIGADNPYTMSIASQNLQMDERLRDIIIERNWFTSGAGTQLSIYVEATDSTIRNNIFDMSEASKYKTFIRLTPPGTSPPVSNVSIYNNTMYGGNKPSISGNEFMAVHIDSTATDIRVLNNLISAPNDLRATNPFVTYGSGTGLVSSHNSSVAQIKTSPNFSSVPPSVPSDYKLAAKSYGISAGAEVPVFSDFFLNNRPPYHLGATGPLH